VDGIWNAHEPIHRWAVVPQTRSAATKELARKSYCISY
jgi:hypothetical protein